jgi:hypothetical protein
MFHQTFQPRDLLLVLVLVVLEGLLSIDNALVLGLLARKLPGRLQTKALTYGLIGSFAAGMANRKTHWRRVSHLRRHQTFRRSKTIERQA